MKKTTNYFKAILLAVAILIAICLEFKNIETNEFDAEVVVHFVDVGQGDCSIVQTPAGNVIIDAGVYEADNNSSDSTVSYINSLGISDFVYAIFTHPHSDHIGGAETVISKYNVDTLIIPNAVNTSATFRKMLDAIEENDCSVTEGKAGVSIDLGETKIELLAPVKDDYQSLNDASVVAKITYGDISFLFAGDAEVISERDMLENDYEALDSTILKVAHHGSSTSSSKEFIKAVSPEVAIYSCGKNNEYGHPHKETVKLIDSVVADSYRTDKNGNIIITTDGLGYEVYTEK